ncbi:MAG: hypothetical protein ABEJ86_03920 [Halococcoides sp.]
MSGRFGRPGAVLLGIVVVALLAGGVAARAPPEPLCQVCSDAVVPEDAITSSTVTIRVGADGTGHWRVELALADQTSLDPDRVRTAAKNALSSHLVGTPNDPSVAVGSDAIVIEYTTPDLAARSVTGVLVVDAFYTNGERSLGVNVDRVVLRGPPGTTVVGPDADGETVEIDGVSGDRFAGELPSGGFHVAFADDSIAGVLAAQTAIWMAVASATVADLPSYAPIPIAVLAIAVATMGGAGRRFDRLSIALRTILAVTVLALWPGAIALIAGANGAGPAVAIQHGVFGPLVAIVIFVGTVGPLPVVGSILALVGSRLFVQSDTLVEWGVDRVVAGGAVLASVTIAVGSLVAGIDGPAGGVFARGIIVTTPALFVPFTLAERRSVRAILGCAIVLAPVFVVIGLGPLGPTQFVVSQHVFVPWALVVGTVSVLFGATGDRSAESESKTGPA